MTRSSRGNRRARAVAPPSRVYSKPPLCVTDMLNRLSNRGLVIDDQMQAENVLNTIGYFRLLIYMRRFQDRTGQFHQSAKFSDIVELYEFDRKLRLLTIDAIERLEVGLRAALSNIMSISHGPHWHQDQSHFEDLVKHHGVLAKIIHATSNKKSIALKHYRETYREPPTPPIWLTCEKLSFGTLSCMFSDLKIDKRKAVSKPWGFSEVLLVSWFRSLTDLRNECAHHGRLWNTYFMSNSPAAPNTYREDFGPDASFYNRACVIYLLLKSLGKDRWWKESLLDIFASNPIVLPTPHLGFPHSWETRKLWQ